jgi:hypothetical protein
MCIHPFTLTLTSLERLSTEKAAKIIPNTAANARTAGKPGGAKGI